jgi:hypothetical protein
MPEKEEGAAFFQPVTMGEVPPRPMGLQRDMLTGGFAEAQARLNEPRVMGLQPNMLTGGFAEAQARSSAPRVMGLNPELLTRGFPSTRGVGADAPPTSGYWDWVAGLNPWVVAGVSAAVGFGGTCLWRKR